MLRSPRVDKRTGADISHAVRTLLARYVEGLPPESGRSTGSLEALIEIFTRFSEIIIDRLNRTPEKNFLAFLDLLGFSPLPPQPASAPVTFSLSSQTAAGALVPTFTQIAASPAQGEQEPTVFETQAALNVVSATLDSIFSKNVETDRYADYSTLIAAPGLIAIDPFSGTAPVEHVLYIGLGLLPPAPALKRITLTMILEGSPKELFRSSSLVWEAWEGTGVPLQQIVQAAQTANQDIREVFFNDPPVFPKMTIQGETGGWLRCRCLTPIIEEPSGRPGTLSETQVPILKSLTIRTEANRAGLLPDQALSNGMPVDLTKDFLPFGEKPKIGDTLYVSSEEAFSMPGARITVHIKLTAAAQATAEPSPPTVRPRAAQIRWEFWNGVDWGVLGESEQTAFSDTTQAFTADGDVSFQLAEALPQTTLKGQKGRWIRVRIISGDYGQDTRFEQDPTRGYVFIPATFSPPSISSLKLEYTAEDTHPPTSIIKYNDFSYIKIPQGQPFGLFDPIKEDRPSLYLGFDVPAGQTFSRQSATLYVDVGPLQSSLADGQFSDSSRLSWWCWNGRSWERLTVRDNTAGFLRSGLVHFVAPADFTANEEFGKVRFWLKVSRNKENIAQPLLRSILINTTLAAQVLTIFNENLGSSTGRPNQTFRTVRHPVVPGEQLVVREAEMPTAKERTRIEQEEGFQAIRQVTEQDGKSEGVWVRWHEVPDFYRSGSRDRHYVVNRGLGEICFGDGINGLIPPVLPKNISLQRYQTGGGAAGNKPPLSITQLRTSVPYIDRVTNLHAAEGGGDAESIDQVVERAPRQIRHGLRAVTAEDFEDLVKLGDSHVARAKCIPLYDLARDPDARTPQPGTVSIIIIPFSSDVKPLPSAELLQRVRSFLDDHRILTADLVLLGAEYVRIDLSIELRVTGVREPTEVELDVRDAVRRFLNPLTGRPQGTGWDFGQLPKEAEIYSLIHRISGVDHVRALQLTPVPERAGAQSTARFLVYAGACNVSTFL